VRAAAEACRTLDGASIRRHFSSILNRLKFGMFLKFLVFKNFAERRRIVTWQRRCECIEDVVWTIARSRHESDL
jgi:hypothetical protein